MMKFENEAAMIAFGKKLGQALQPNMIITLNGELGAGKTTLTKGIGAGLGVKRVINSPTFTILKSYEGRLTLNHFDAYRLEGQDDDLGFEEIFDDGGVCVIEWPEFISDIIPQEHLDITIYKNEDNTRCLELKPTGKKYEDLVNAMKMTLVMDTSNQYLGIGLYRGDEKLEAILVNESKRQSEYAIPKLQEILKHQNVSLMDIDEMVITKGPGSYTGERVAMTIAKTLAVIAPVKIKVVSSLAAYAGNSKAISIIDARSHKLFVGVFDQGKNVVEEQLMSIDDFEDLRKHYPDYKIVGDGELVGVESDNSQLVENIFALSKKEEPVEQPDLLVPQYIKEVEAKKACY